MDSSAMVCATSIVRTFCVGRPCAKEAAENDVARRAMEQVNFMDDPPECDSLNKLPQGLKIRRMHQRLHHHAILFRFLPQAAELFFGCLRSGDIEMKTNARKADGNFFRYAEGASKIQVAFYRDLNALGWDAHRRGYHLTGN